MSHKKDKPIILLIDDVAANIQMLASFLSDQYRIKIATSGEKGLSLANDQPSPDLILLDIEMPDIDGYEVCRTLKQSPVTKNIPIIFVTAKDDDSDEEIGLQLGAVDYITKPLRPAIVKARVNAHITLKLQRDRLKELALKDQLTTLYNRHYLVQTAPLKIAKAKRHNYVLGITVLDIDHFKSINDNYGHTMGDQVLQSVATVLKDSTRKEDIAARLGGEEFLILFDHCEAGAIEQKVESIRQAIEKLNPDDISVTASFGVTEFQPDTDTFETFYQRADKALYQAKNNGRNRVVKQ